MLWVVKSFCMGQQSEMEKMRNWAILGRLAAIERSRKSRIPKLAFETELAAKLGVSRGTLRNYADAVRLVRTIPDHEMRAMLFRSSAVAAAVASRWFQRDPENMMGYLRSASTTEPRRIIDDRALLAAERVARHLPLSPSAHRHSVPADLSLQVRRAIEESDRWRWRDEVAHLFEGTLSSNKISRRLTLVTPEGTLFRFLGLTHLLLLHDTAVGNSDYRSIDAAKLSQSVALIDVGARVVPERYRAESRIIWSRALGASLYVKMAVLILPGSAARRQFISQIPFEGVEWTNHPSQPPSATRSDRRGRSRPILARHPLHRTTIMIATRRSLLSDLFG